MIFGLIFLFSEKKIFMYLHAECVSKTYPEIYLPGTSSNYKINAFDQFASDFVMGVTSDFV